jgi:hypothetical protein
MARSTARTRVRPAKDEWGVYDPQQAGLAALFAKLDTTAPPKEQTPVQKLEAKKAIEPQSTARLLRD